MILLSIEISMLPKPPWMVMVFDCSRWAPKRWHQGPGFEIPNPGCDILFLTKDWDWSSLFPVCSWICISHSHLHGWSYCARSVKFWNKRWKVWKCGAVDEKCGAQWMTGFGRKLFTALPRWNSSTSLIERLLQIYGGIDVILVELWVRGT